MEIITKDKILFLLFFVAIIEMAALVGQSNCGRETTIVQQEQFLSEKLFYYETKLVDNKEELGWWARSLNQSKRRDTGVLLI